MNYSEIQIKIQNAQQLDLGNILDHCIKMFKEVWLKGFLMVIIIAVASVGLTFLFSALGLAPDPYSTTWYEDFNFYSYYTSNALYSLPQAILIGSLSTGLLAGFFRIVKQQDTKGMQSDDLFYYFSSGYINKIFMLGIIYSIIATAAQLLFVIPYICLCSSIVFCCGIFK